MVTAVFAGLTYLFIEFRAATSKAGRMILINPILLVNTIITGLCASSGTCRNTSIVSSAFIGIIAAILYHESIRLLERLEIDDPV